MTERRKTGALQLLWKYPSIWVISMLVFYIPFGNIAAFCMQQFFELRTGRTFNYETLINGLYDIGIMDIVFELSFITVIIVFARYVDKFSYQDLGLAINLSACLNLMKGVAVAAIFMTLPFLLYWALGMVEIRGMFWDKSNSKDTYFDYVVFQAISLFLVALQEELLHRAYLLNIFSGMKPRYAILISALIFSGVHIISIGAGALTSEFLVTTIGLVNILLIGLIYGYYYWHTKDLWFVIGAHLGWNFMMGPVFGMPISGLPGKGLFVSEVTGQAFLTGGSFGPEGGVVVTLSLFGMYFVIKKLWIKKTLKYVEIV